MVLAESAVMLSDVTEEFTKAVLNNENERNDIWHQWRERGGGGGRERGEGEREKQTANRNLSLQSVI